MDESSFSSIAIGTIIMASAYEITKHFAFSDSMPS